MLRMLQYAATAMALSSAAALCLGASVIPTKDTFCVQTFGEAFDCEFVLLQKDDGSDVEALKKPGYSAVRFDRARLQPVGRKSGLAALVRAEALDVLVDDYPVDQDGVVDWIRHQLGMVNSVGMIDTRLPRSHIPVMVINTHLHPWSKEVRIAQIIHLAGKILQLMPSDRPLVLAGNFEVASDSLEGTLIRSLLLMESAIDEEAVKGKDVDAVYFRGSQATALELEKAAIVRQDESSFGIKAQFEARPVPPKTLALDAKELDVRIKTALASLKEAQGALEGAGDDYKETRTMIAILSRSLEEKDAHDLLIDYFRTP